MISPTKEQELHGLLSHNPHGKRIESESADREVIANVNDVRGFDRKSIYEILGLKHQKIDGADIGFIHELNDFYMRIGNLGANEVEEATVTQAELLGSVTPDAKLQYLCQVLRGADGHIVASAYASLNRESRMALLRFGVAHPRVRGTGAMQELFRLVFEDMGEVDGIAGEAVNRSRHFVEGIRVEADADAKGMNRLYLWDDAAGAVKQIHYQIPDLHPNTQTGENTEGPVPENLMLVMRGLRSVYPGRTVRKVVDEELYGGWYEPQDGAFPPAALERRRQLVHESRDEILSGIPPDASVYAISRAQQDMLEDHGFTFQHIKKEDHSGQAEGEVF